MESRNMSRMYESNTNHILDKFHRQTVRQWLRLQIKLTTPMPQAHAIMVPKGLAKQRNETHLTGKLIFH